MPLMNTSRLARSTALLFVLLAFVVGLSAVSRITASGPVAQDEAASEYKPLRKLLRERDLDVSNERACNEATPEDLAALVNDSLAIVVGSIVDARSGFDGDDGVVTFHSFKVHQVVKNPPPRILVARGKAEPDPVEDYLTFRRFSGVVSEYGHTLRVRLPGDERIGAGKTMILFLRWDPIAETYFPVADAAGIFLVTGEGRVEPVLPNLVARYGNGAALDEFLQRIVESR